MDDTEVKAKAKIKTKKLKNKPPMPKNKKVAIAVFVVGMIMLVAGLVFLIINLTKGTAIQDGEFLVSAENWVLENEPGVVWDFTEIGKGTLTTNAHENDYDFAWAIEEGKLLIETDWLYALQNEYEYELNQLAGTLTLHADSETYTFVAQR